MNQFTKSEKRRNNNKKRRKTIHASKLTAQQGQAGKGKAFGAFSRKNIMFQQKGGYFKSNLQEQNQGKLKKTYISKDLHKKFVANIVSFFQQSKAFDEKEKSKITKKYLNFGNQNTFNYLLQLLFQEISPQSANRIANDLNEENLPDLFKNMGYPFLINPKIFQPNLIGNQWGHILQIFNWLIEFIKQIYQFFQRSQNWETKLHISPQDVEENTRVKQLINSKTEKDSKKLKEEYQEQLDKEIQKLNQEREKLKKVIENNHLQMQNLELQQPDEKVENEKEELMQEEIRLQNQIVLAEQQKFQEENIYQETNKVYQEKLKEIIDLEEQISSTKNQLDTQQFGIHSAIKIEQNIQRYENQIEQHQLQIKEQVETITQNNNQLSTLKYSLEDQASQLNRKWMINPTMIQNLDKNNINITFDWEQIKFLNIFDQNNQEQIWDKLVSVDLHNYLQQIKKIQHKTLENINQNRNRLAQLEENVKQTEIKNKEDQMAITNLKNKIQQVKFDVNSKSLQLKELEQNANKENSDFQQKIIKINSNLNALETQKVKNSQISSTLLIEWEELQEKNTYQKKEIAKMFQEEFQYQEKQFKQRKQWRGTVLQKLNNIFEFLEKEEVDGDGQEEEDLMKQL